MRTILVKDLVNTPTLGELSFTPLMDAYFYLKFRSFGMAFLTLFRIATGNIQSMKIQFVVRMTLSNSPCGVVRSISIDAHAIKRFVH